MRGTAARGPPRRAPPLRASADAATTAPTTTPATPPPPPPATPSSLNGGRGGSGRALVDADVDFLASEAALSDWVSSVVCACVCVRERERGRWGSSRDERRGGMGHTRATSHPPHHHQTSQVDAVGLRDNEIDDLVASLASSYDPARLDAGLAPRRAQLAARAARVIAAAASFAGSLARDAATGSLEANAAMRAAELREAMVAAGPSFVKIGQILSSRPDLLPKPYLAALSILQDAAAPFSSALARAVIEQELGSPVDQIFATLSPEPVAAASLGQVYRGTLASTGQDVAVKVQRPGVAATLAMDMALLRRLAAAVDARAPALAALADFIVAQPLAPLVDEFAARLFGELDYIAEGQSAEKFEALYAGEGTRVRVPGVVWSATARRVLTTEWCEGVKLTDAAAMDAAGLNVVDMVQVGIECTLRQLLEVSKRGWRRGKRRGLFCVDRSPTPPPHTHTHQQHGFFHADPHPGNLLAAPDGYLVVLDFGMMSESPPTARTAIIAHVAHLVARDFDAMTKDYCTLGFVDASVDTSPIAPYLADFFGDVLATPVNKLNFQKIVEGLGGVLFKFPFRAPPYYVLILRSLTVLEGLALATDPEFKLLGAVWPYMARRLLTDRGPALRDALAGLVLEKEPPPSSTRRASPPRFKWDTVDGLLEAASQADGGLDGADLAALARWALGADDHGDGEGGDNENDPPTTTPAPARLRAAAAAEAARALDAAVADNIRTALRVRGGDALAERLAPSLPGDAVAAARARALAEAAGPHLPPALAAAVGVGGGGVPPPSITALSTAARDALAAVSDALATSAGRDAAAALASELGARFAARTVKAVLGPAAGATSRRRVSAFETGGREAR